eukprot:scaffold210453_cov44-Attheya_sp.AAC.1
MSENILGCARFISIPLHFTDHLREIIKVQACSIYHPTGRKITQQVRAEFLDSIDNLYNKLDRNDYIIIAGCDTNSSIGNKGSTYCQNDGTAVGHG